MGDDGSKETVGTAVLVAIRENNEKSIVTSMCD